MGVFLKALLLAAVEGATEFLPVSSTGHLILVESFIELTPDEQFNNVFMIVIQLPAILAVVVYFWSELWPFTRAGTLRRDRITLWAKIALAMVPVVVLGPLLDGFLEAHLFAPVPVAVALLVGGLALILIERRTYAVSFETTPEIPARTAFFIGLFQCLAMVPGTSRSAATIIGGMLLGASRPVAAEFSFFLAVPTMFAATAYSLLKHGVSFTGEQWAIIGVGSVASFIVAYAAIAAFMDYIRRRSFAAFGYYRIALAVLVFAAALLGWID